MSEDQVRFTVFTKAWKMPIPELGAMIRGLGVYGIELPVRPGYQVEPGQVTRALPAAARQLAESGVKIHSVAGPADEPTIAACAQVGVPVLRVMAPVGPEGYLAAERRLQEEYDALVPLLDRYGVTLGVQNHCGRWVTSAIGLRRLVEKYDPRHVAAVWDPAHCALDGELPELAADILSSHLCMVNLKNACWRRRAAPPGSGIVEWEHYWTTGREGLASWPDVAAELRKRHYRGVVCLSAQYSDEQSVDRFLAEDVAFARSLFA